MFVFHDRNTMKELIESGRQFGAHADAAAKAGNKGGAGGGAVLLDGVTIYQITASGLALQAAVEATKYWSDMALNCPPDQRFPTRSGLSNRRLARNMRSLPIVRRSV